MSNVEKKVEVVKGELTYEDKVIQKIIGLSLENVPGLLAIDGGFFGIRFNGQFSRFFILFSIKYHYVLFFYFRNNLNNNIFQNIYT